MMTIVLSGKGGVAELQRTSLSLFTVATTTTCSTSSNCSQPTGMQSFHCFHTLRSPCGHGPLSPAAPPLRLLGPRSLKLGFLASRSLSLSFSEVATLQRHFCGFRRPSSPAMAHHDFDIPTSPEAAADQDKQQSHVGSIHLIVGPMFAGKTTALLKRVQAEASSGRKVAMVKSDKDTRYGLKSVVSHNGVQMPCWAVPSLASFRDQIGEEAYSKIDLIGIDEAQFLKDLYSFSKIAADHEGKTLIIAGLDGDFERNRFGSILDLIPIADSVIKLSSYCELCGKPAGFTFRKTDEMEKEVIGGTNKYMPVCRQHYFSGKAAMEVARTALDVHKVVSFQYDHMNKKISEVM